MDLTVAVSVSGRLTGGERDDLPEAQCFAAGYDLSKGMVRTGWGKNRYNLQRHSP